MTRPVHTLLLIKDSAPDREQYCRSLLSDLAYDYRFLEASSARSGLELCQTYSIDAILFDDRLADGLQFLQLLHRQSNGSSPPVVIVTDKSDVSAAVQAMKLGAEDYLVKRDLTAELLQLTLRNAIENARLRQQESQCEHDRLRGESERKRIEAELREREEQMRLFIKYAPAGVAMFDREMCYLVASDRWLTSYGLEEQDITGRSHYEIFPDVPDQWRELHQRGLSGEVLACEEDAFPRTDGSIDWVRWEIRPWHKSTNEIGGIIIFSEVITERKQVELALRESQVRFEAFMRHCPTAAYIKDEAGHYLYSNSLSEKLFGIPIAEWLGKTDFELFPTQNAQQWRDHDLEVLETNQLLEVTEAYQQGDSELTFLSFKFPIQLSPEQRLVGGLSLDISERKRAEQRIQESQAQLANILESITDAFVSFDEFWNFTFVNSQAGKLLQRLPADLIGKNVWEEFPEGVGTEFDQAYRRAIAEQATVHIESFYPPLNVWLEVRIYPTQRGLAVYFRDVTGRKTAEQERYRLLKELEIAQNRLEQILQQMPVGVVITEAPSGKVQFLNDEGNRIFRHSLREAETVEEYTEYSSFHTDGRPYQPEEYPVARSLLSGAVIQAEEMLYRRGDGTETILSVSAAPIFSPDGQLIAVVGTFDDIADRKQVEEQLRQSEERYRSLGGLIPQLVWIADSAGTLLDMNDRWSEFTGLTLEQAQSQGWEAVVHPEDVPSLAQAWSTVQQEGTGYQAEGRMRRADGSYRWHLHQAMPLKDDQGRIVKWFGTATDIHDLKRSEVERNRLLTEAEVARAEAEAANRSKDEFVSLIAHELRSPLNAIQGWAKLLQNQKLDAAMTHKALEIIIRNTQAQTQLIEDLLDVSRMVRGSLRLTLAEVDLATIIEAAVETVRPTAAAKGVVLETQLDALTPLSGDFGRLQQVVLNLLTNAIKFTPSGGQVQILLDQQNMQARIQVIDTGKGISSDFLPHIFKRFQQDQQNTTAKQGLGLGLAIVQYIVEQHGGTVTAQSAGKDQGTTFTVLLPLLRGGDEVQPETLAALPADGIATVLSGVRVLLVDDDRDMLNLTALILEQAGAVVETAISAAIALENLAQFQPDILLSDIAMPDHNGYDLLRQVRTINPAGQVPAIALTAYSSEAHREDSLRAGFAYHLTKPVEPETLIRTMLSVLQRRAV